MSSCRFKLCTAVCAVLIASTAAHAADIAVQPAARSGFVFKDAIGANERPASVESTYNDLAEIKRQLIAMGRANAALQDAAIALQP